MTHSVDRGFAATPSKKLHQRIGAWLEANPKITLLIAAIIVSTSGYFVEAIANWIGA